MHLVNFKDLMGQHLLFSVGMLLVAGFFIGHLAMKVKLPEITGFIVAGLLMGEAVTGIIPIHVNKTLQIVTEVALSLIALTIGSEFSLAKLKKLGVKILAITFIQLFLTFGSVAIALFLFGLELPYALLLGAIASATAPAATVAIVQSLKARGPFVDYLYGVVALDDVGCVLLFGVIFAVVSGNMGGGAAGSAQVFHAIMEISGSILVGVLNGILIHIAAAKRKSSNEILIIVLGILFIFTAVAIVFNLSPLLMNMMAGAVIINLSPKNHRLFRILEPLTPPVYALFFILAGLELRPAVLLNGQVLLFGSVYILSRAVGKYGGVFSAGLITKTDPKIRNYLGFCMLPQAGVAIGLILLIQVSPIVNALPGNARVIIDTMVNIVLLSVFVNELIGPPLSRFAIIRGNDMEE